MQQGINRRFCHSFGRLLRFTQWIEFGRQCSCSRYWRRLAIADVSTTRPMPGIELERDVQTDPPMRFYVVNMDLTNPRIHLKVSRAGDWQHLPQPWEVKLMTVSEMAERDGLFVAVNGNLFQCRGSESILGINFPYFWGNWARTNGWAMSDGLLFSGSPADMDWPSLMVNDRGKVAIGRLDRIPLDARQIVSGIWQIVTDGRDTVGGDAGRSGAPRAPRGGGNRSGRENAPVFRRRWKTANVLGRDELASNLAGNDRAGSVECFVIGRRREHDPGYAERTGKGRCC